MSSSLSSALSPPPPPPPPPSPSDSPRHRHHFLPFLAATSTADLPSAHLPHPPAPTTSSYNTLIRSLSRSRDCKPLALRLYRRMLFDGTAAPPDNFTFPFVLKAAAFLSAFLEGTQIHTHILKLGFASDTYVCNSLIHFYASCGRQSLARRLFDRMLRRTRVSWNVTIDGYVANGDYDTALDLFREMQRSFTPDEYTLQSVICACGGIGSLSLGMWAHAFIFKNFDDKVVNDVLINNSLLDAYSKCGSITIARQVFDRMPTRDVTSWNVMILGLAMHGHVDECFEAFARMSEVEKLKPNSITFVGILSACDHGGLVDEGRKYFDLMVTEFGIEPRIEHYGCMVDLLARAGLIDEALDLVSNMQCKPDAVIWRSLLDACCKRNAGVEVSESVARRALEFEDVGTSGVYVLLSRVYASANRWDDVGLVRKLMIDEGIRKEPGCSSIEMDGVVHHFLAGDTSHPRSGEIYGMLHEVENKLALVGYKPDSSQAPMVAEFDDAKEDSLRFHSERLAIAFGLLNRAPGTPIRILKNLRVCRDCHAITKLISQEYNVEIIVRDRTRFHHFRDGLCSCMDYW
uniref:Pentatricopeptide repeat-containing protein At1g59720, chloroplastic/mitochondrial n=1 Tax=Elaeis guineensis var. tenera TaxID=51953 RepID=A0A6I9RAG4_ELAGV|nr:pentatricopeptide repeat-containing protein At1g59720, chloroplastic/mitochondrial [Elaeis guineensis]